MNARDGRDLDLNLLRVFAVVAETGSVTTAASRLYLTQPAISAALKRLTTAIGAPLFARRGRGLVLTARGKQLERTAAPALRTLLDAALSPTSFDPRTSEATIRLGLGDATEWWFLSPLLQLFAREAPHMRLLVVPVHFRDISEALRNGRVDLAVAMADDVPAGTHREPVAFGTHTCLYDPRSVRLPKKLTLAAYLAHEHVLVSYNQDFRGVVEDMFGHRRRVRCSLSSFFAVGDAIDGTGLLATVPAIVAKSLCRHRPHLRTTKLPFDARGAWMELLLPPASIHDDAIAFVADHLRREAAKLSARPVSAARS